MGVRREESETRIWGERRGRDKRLRDGWPLEEPFPTIVRALSTYTVACVLCNPVIFWTFAFRFSRDENRFSSVPC